MKTTVSIPDGIFRQAEQFARGRGLSRDEMYADALAEYVRRRETRDDQELIDRINAACEKCGPVARRGFGGHPRPESSERKLVIRRGDIYWAELPVPRLSEPGYRRPVVIIQDDRYNLSGLPTVIGVAITSNLAAADAPGNLRLTAAESGLPKDSVVLATQVITVAKRFLGDRIGTLSDEVMFRGG